MATLATWSHPKSMRSAHKNCLPFRPSSVGGNKVLWILIHTHTYILIYTHIYTYTYAYIVCVFMRKRTYLWYEGREGDRGGNDRSRWGKILSQSVARRREAKRGSKAWNVHIQISVFVSFPPQITRQRQQQQQHKEECKQTHTDKQHTLTHTHVDHAWKRAAFTPNPNRA